MQTLNGRRIAAIEKPATPMSPGGKKNDPTGLETSAAYTIANEFPTPRDRHLEWVCADPENPVDPEVFHPVDLIGLREAQAICGTCPSAALCAELGLSRKEWGVWGGLLLEAGKVRDEPRKAGRPNGNKAAREASAAA